jgi:RNA polymerase sigma-70 factor (ECF subfamily)
MFELTAGGSARSIRCGEDLASNGRMVQTAVAAAKRGDKDAIHFLYVRFAPELRRFVWTLIGDAHESQDIVQDVFAKLIKVIGKYEERDVPFDAWIKRVARNAAIDHMRGQRSIPTEELRLTEPENSGARVEKGRTLREALGELPTDQRKVVTLRYVLGLSPGEIARELGKTESSVHGLHNRGRSVLESTLREYDSAPVVRK